MLYSIVCSVITSDDAKEAFYQGKWTIKFHGSNGFLIKQNGKLELWERRDIKDKNIDEINEEFIELDFINNNPNYNKYILPDEYQSNEKHHKYILVKLSPDSKKGKILYNRLEKNLIDTDNIFQSIEYVGKKVQGNEEQFNWRSIDNKNYGVVIHSSIECIIPDISFQKLIEIAKDIKIEGWVIYHNNKVWKVRTNMLVDSKECAYSKKGVADCKPFVY